MKFIEWRELIGEDVSKFTRCRLSRKETDIVIQALDFSDRIIRESIDRADRMAKLIPYWVELVEGLEITAGICMANLNEEYETEVTKLFIGMKPKRKKHVRKILGGLVKLKIDCLTEENMKNLASRNFLGSYRILPD
jgi:hypothetical protein